MGLRPTHGDESRISRPIDSKWVKARLSTEFPWACGPPIEMKISSSGAYDHRVWTAKVVSTLDEVRP
jgi:hypothetical protein